MSNYISWCYPEALIPPHNQVNPEKYQTFIEKFTHNGWGQGYPALIGYWWEGYNVQLLYGTHRYYAAKSLNLLIPTVIHEFEIS